MASPSTSLGGRVIPLFRIGGIEIAFTPSWLVMVTALSMVFRVSVVPASMGKVSGAAASVGLTLLFYVFVLVHEAAHTVVAATFGLQPRRIVLFMLGGVSQIGRDAEEPRQEYLVALAGPLASLVLAGILAAATRVAGQPFDGVWGTLAVVNVALAMFNLIPGFPLDGGRVFRSSVWALTGDRVRATRWAAVGGRVVGAGFIAGSIAYMLWAAGEVGDAVQGVWFAVFGWFLYSHAVYAGREEIEREIIREQARREALATVPAQPPAGDIVPGQPDRVTPTVAAATLVPDSANAAEPAAKATPRKKKPGESNASKPKADRRRGSRPNRARSAPAPAAEPRDGAGHSRRRPPDAGRGARRGR
ncbi:MAG: site-2 protease family protein [Actinomycetota bacterium]